MKILSNWRFDKRGRKPMGTKAHVAGGCERARPASWGRCSTWGCRSGEPLVSQRMGPTGQGPSCSQACHTWPWHPHHPRRHSLPQPPLTHPEKWAPKGQAGGFQASLGKAFPILTSEAPATCLACARPLFPASFGAGRGTVGSGSSWPSPREWLPEGVLGPAPPMGPRTDPLLGAPPPPPPGPRLWC